MNGVEQRTEAKRLAWDYLERNKGPIANLSDALFWFAEPAMQEHRSAALMTELLQEADLEVTSGISGFPTAFLARSGGGEGPTIALHTEYDANPRNSQVPGIAEPREIVPGAPGHCEGHNINGAVMVAAAIAVERVRRRLGLPGHLKVFGAPAEEMILARPYFVRDGWFDDVDAAFHAHVYDTFSTEYGQLQIAAVSAEFTFHGESVHAAMAPWKGRDALDAVVLMDSGFAQHREHMEPQMRAHRVITNGGAQPNVIPAEASIWWYFRDRTAAGARRLFDTARRIAEGAALMTGTTVEVDVRSAVWPVMGNEPLARVLQQNIEAVGMPGWDEGEQTLARALQRAAGRPEQGLRTAHSPLEGPSQPIMASNDCGDVSWKVPMGRLWFPGNVPGLTYHHWSAGSALATTIAHKAALAGAKALAGAVLDCLLDPEIVERAGEAHRRHTEREPYQPLLPPEQQPNLKINSALMQHFRPLLEAHQPKTRPQFGADLEPAGSR